MSESPRRTNTPPVPPDEDTNTASEVRPPAGQGTRYPYLLIIAGSRVGELYKLTKELTVVGRSADADLQITDEGVSRTHVEFVVDDGVVMAKDLGSTNGTFCNGIRISQRPLADGDKLSIGSTTILKFSYQDGVDAAFQIELYKSALRDTLTSGLKKEHFTDRLKEEVAFSLRHNAPLALIFWDLDRFKAVNDTHGHLVGDRVLTATANAVHALVRREDIFARCGGEEFAVACRLTPLGQALPLAERIRRAIEATTVDIGTKVLNITASIGIAICPGEGITDAQTLISAADQAMYRAKALGRNRIEVSRQGHPPKGP
jgi:two-component system, cell cycle response regulator